MMTASSAALRREFVDFLLATGVLAFGDFQTKSGRSKEKESGAPLTGAFSFW